MPFATVDDQSRKGVRAWSDGRGPLHDGRSIVVGVVALYLALVAGMRALRDLDIWPWLGVPSGPSIFFDARNVAAAVECSRLGHDPLVDNPCDPWGRVMFYPRVWLVLRWTGLEQRHTLLFGVVVITVFFVLLLLLFGRLSVVEGLVVAVAVCSPAVMFAVERANMDLVVFSGLALSALVWRRGSARAEFVAVALVLLMAVAKLYPAVALLAFLPTRRRSTRVAAAVAVLVFVLYAVATREDVATISSTATQGQYYSYGARILLGELYHGVLGEQWGGSRALAQVMVLLAAVVLGLALWLWLRHRSRRSAEGEPVPEMPETSDLIAFRMGALVYVGTFVAGNSFDYRLVFLLLTLPYLLRWPLHRGGAEPATLPRVAAAVVLVQLWVGTLSEQLRLLDELVSWTLAGMLVVLLARSAPSATAVLRGRASADSQGRAA
jgi:Glycosyltransferase family 87